MNTIWARHALLPQGWARDVSVQIGKDGRIAAVRAGVAQVGLGYGILLPAPVNVHSHGFQRAMAGLTEGRGSNPGDSFWTWRQLMFRFLDHLTPEHIETITALAQMEMLESGYAASAEFHYLHHQPGGIPYDNIAETSDRIAAAADQTGIGLCLLPVHYQFGGCDGRGLGAGQIRFGNDFERFQVLHDAAAKALRHLPPDTNLGVAPHSLRAVGAGDLAGYGDLFPDGPIHMHLAEQIAEVDEVRHHRGARPVEWALANMGLDARWCLIHCTQMMPSETVALARSGANAGLCPITESNLGDGIFDGVRWMQQGGRIAIGSDSNIRISLSEELRTLEYSQRLRDHSRAALATGHHSTGRRLFDAVLGGGALATGRDTGAIRTGVWADLLCLDDGALPLVGRTGDVLLDSWIFAGDDGLISDVWSAGRHMVQNGCHIHRTAIMHAYRRTLLDLQATI
ncbi:formimidoylglutamate deiminase [Oceaniglobus ichthyenteri]|uniref:formimidoylglutamate deiminase n=1 Tax=Oceaniglobus ichthyenteri TaxID=2136177 RepID=UPI000D370843|nr:formimidoylglutamate deiminase [Oceaniglobus ichthyenteri]